MKRAAWIKRREGGRGTGRGAPGILQPDTARHGSEGRQHKRSQISFSLTRHDNIITGGEAAAQAVKEVSREERREKVQGMLVDVRETDNLASRFYEAQSHFNDVAHTRCQHT